MADLQAQYLNDLIAGNSRPVETDLQMPDAGELSLTAGGVTSSVYGNLNFLTPIAELSIDKVTNAEESAYNRWRNRYQRQWRQFFDPIALRFSIESEKIGSDLTVMPLIEGTDYRQFIDITKGAKIVANAGDRHPETLLHIAVAINLDAALINQGSNMARALAPGLSTNPLGWLGDSISVYLDDDPIWAELKSEQDFEQFMENGGISRLPIAVHFAVKNPLGVTAFLTILRVFMEQTAPGMTTWENLTHQERSYVRIVPSAMAQAEVPDEIRDLAIYYSVTPKSLVITLSEDVLFRALERQNQRLLAKSEGREIPDVNPSWIGENLCLQVSQRFLEFIEKLSGEAYQDFLRARSWGNLPIFNEWKRLYSDHDASAFHEKFWQTRLVCPGGGAYVWNEEWQTMESTVYGHPGNPKEVEDSVSPIAKLISANFGITFEEDGLRAIVVLDRE
jgi:EAL domain-containing protein (putative c-di-GMP-specific phosphodiesterase class I)